MVEVEVVLLAVVQQPALDGRVNQKAVQALCRVEAVLLAALGRIDGVFHGQLSHRTQYGIGAADAEARLLLYNVMYAVDVFRHVATTAEVLAKASGKAERQSMASEISLY
jgi:hypothetical protein